MNLGVLKNLAFAKIPQAKGNELVAPFVVDILNEATIDIVSNLDLIHKNVTFDVEADTAEYSLSTIADDFMRVDSSGIYWNAGSGSSPNWIKVDVYTREKLDREFLNWRSDSSGQPERYFIESDTLTFHFTPDTDLTDGFWLYYIAVPETMSLNSHYPFVTDTEVPQYKTLNETIIKYWEWKAYEILGDVEKSNNAFQVYQVDLLAKKQKMNRRMDILNEYNLELQGKIMRGRSIR